MKFVIIIISIIYCHVDFEIIVLAEVILCCFLLSFCFVPSCVISFFSPSPSVCLELELNCIYLSITIPSIPAGILCVHYYYHR